jgi:hypothetical protein
MHRIFVMTRAAQNIQDRYEAMMFAKSAEAARKAAYEFTQAVLGEKASQLSLQEALRETCRRLRPSSDPKEQQRFENELIELGIWPAPTHESVAA